MFKRLKYYHYSVLLIGLMLMLLSEPLVEFLGFGQGRLAFDVMNVLIFLFGVWGIAESRGAFYAGLILGGLTFVAVTLAIASGHGEFRILALLFLLVFLVWVLLLITRDILFGGDVSINRLIGAINVYLIFGLVWAILYGFVFLYEPGSFNGLKHSTEADQHLMLEFIYYSFVTLTTVGYGDIIPVAPLSRTLAFLEAAAGQVYLTFLVAGLVGVHLASRRSSSRESSN